MAEMKKIVYYSDELRDEFSTAVIQARPIDENYDYGGKTFSWKVKRFFLHRIFAQPIAVLYLKLVFRHRIMNRSVLKKYKKGPMFVYGNHTNVFADPLVPTFVSFPQQAFVIVHPNNVSMPVWGKIMPYLGALPLPDNFSAMKNFIGTVKYHVEHNKSIYIYPEAHIWPFYTKIRPFPDVSFKYPIDYGCPVFCFTNVYKKRRFSENPKMLTYVDGPFFADEKLSPKERRRKLRDEVYNAMCRRSALNDVEIITYIKKEGPELSGK